MISYDVFRLEHVSLIPREISEEIIHLRTRIASEYPVMFARGDLVRIISGEYKGVGTWLYGVESDGNVDGVSILQTPSGGHIIVNNTHLVKEKEEEVFKVPRGIPKKNSRGNLKEDYHPKEELKQTAAV